MTGGTASTAITSKNQPVSLTVCITKAGPSASSRVPRLTSKALPPDVAPSGATFVDKHADALPSGRASARPNALQMLDPDARYSSSTSRDPATICGGANLGRTCEFRQNTCKLRVRARATDNTVRYVGGTQTNWVKVSRTLNPRGKHASFIHTCCGHCRDGGGEFARHRRSDDRGRFGQCHHACCHLYQVHGDRERELQRSAAVPQLRIPAAAPKRCAKVRGSGGTGTITWATEPR